MCHCQRMQVCKHGVQQHLPQSAQRSSHKRTIELRLAYSRTTRGPFSAGPLITMACDVGASRTPSLTRSPHLQLDLLVERHIQQQLLVRV